MVWTSANNHASLPIVKILQEVPRYVTFAGAVTDDKGILTCTTAFFYLFDKHWGRYTLTEH